MGEIKACTSTFGGGDGLLSSGGAAFEDWGLEAPTVPTVEFEEGVESTLDLLTGTEAGADCCCCCCCCCVEYACGCSCGGWMDRGRGGGDCCC